MGVALLALKSVGMQGTLPTSEDLDWEAFSGTLLYLDVTGEREGMQMTSKTIKLEAALLHRTLGHHLPKVSHSCRLLCTAPPFDAVF